MKFSEILKELRTAKGLTQTDVAKGCKVSMQCISSLEMGTRNPTGATLAALADFFQVSADYLLGRSDDLGAVSIQSGAPELTPEEKELVQLYRSLSPQFRKMAIDMLHLWAQQAAAENGSKKHA